jgi:hypothetical protein
MLERGCLRPAQTLAGDRYPVAVRPTVGRFAPGRRARALHVGWTRDDPASAAGVGDPIDGTGYTMCLLDLDGKDDVYPHERQRRRIVAAARVPSQDECGAASCWRQEEPGTFVYRRPHAADRAHRDGRSRPRRERGAPRLPRAGAPPARRAAGDAADRR